MPPPFRVSSKSPPSVPAQKRPPFDSRSAFTRFVFVLVPTGTQAKRDLRGTASSAGAGDTSRRQTPAPFVATQYEPSFATRRWFTAGTGRPSSVPQLAKVAPSKRASPPRVQNQRKPCASSTIEVT